MYAQRPDDLLRCRPLDIEKAPLMVPEFRNQFSLKRVVSQVFVLSQPLYRQASILVEGFSIYDDVDLAVPWLMRVANKTRTL